MAVLSNKPVNPSRAIVEALGLGKFFPWSTAATAFPPRNPIPRARRPSAGNWVGPQETLIVGDSSVDVLTGRNAGTWTCGVTYGFAPHTLRDAAAGRSAG